MRDVFVIGAGMTPFGPMPDVEVHELARRAAWAAITSAPIEPREIEVCFAGHAYQGPCFGQKTLMKIGLEGIPIFNVENACASGASAIAGVRAMIASGQADIGLAIGGEKLTKKGGGFLPLVADDLDSSMGRVMPSAFAMMADLHMREYGTRVEQIAMVTVKNRANGAKNPYCHMRSELTVDEVLSAPMIADPLTRNMCCPVSDGAAAVVLASEDVARGLERPVRIAASVLNSGRRTPHGIVGSSSEMSIRAAVQAYEDAGLGPEDVDLCETHDPFAFAELMHYEDLGFCAKGEGGSFIEEGHSAIGGRVAFSPSGGLMAKGHPLGATGVAQIAEIFWQLRGEAGDRQVRDARVGLAHTVGGGVTNLESGACSVHILTV